MPSSAMDARKAWKSSEGEWIWKANVWVIRSEEEATISSQ